MDLLKNNDYQLYFEDQSYLEKTHAQIQRDFEMCGFTFNVDNTLITNYSKLFHLLLERLEELSTTGNTSVKNLLYRIDVSEKAILNRMARVQDAEFEEVLTTLIIERSLLKVLTREKYSQ